MDFQAIVRDQLGLMVSWIEGGNQVTVTRDSAGRPLLARAAGSRSKPYAAEFRYDQSGRFLGVRGEFVSVMFPRLLEEAARGGGGDVTATTSPGGGNRYVTAGDMIIDTHQALRRGSRYSPGKPLLRAPTSADGLTLSANVTVTPAVRRGRRCWEVIAPAEAASRNIIFPITSGVYTDKIGMTIEVEDALQWNGGNFRLGLYTSSGITVGMRYILVIGSSNAWTGVKQIAPRSADWAAVGGGSWASTMTHCAITFVRGSNPAPTVPTKFWVYDVAEGERNTLPSIILGADDGHGSWYNAGLPILEKYGFPSYLAYIHDTAMQNGTGMTVTQWQDAIARGHDAVVHGCKAGIASLRDYFSNYAGYASPYAAILADVEYNRDGMIANGLDPSGRGRRIYVYPQGNFQPTGGAGDTTIEAAMIAAGMKTARRSIYECSLVANGAWASARLYLPTIGHSYSTTDEAANIAELIARMQSEINAGRSVVFCFHVVTNTPAAATDISPANLEAIVAAANDLVTTGKAKRGRLPDFADELDTYSGPVHIGE